METQETQEMLRCGCRSPEAEAPRAPQIAGCSCPICSGGCGCGCEAGAGCGCATGTSERS